MHNYNVSEDVLREILALEEAKRKHGLRDRAQKNFMNFVKHCYDGFIEGAHHKKAGALQISLGDWGRRRVLRSWSWRCDYWTWS